MKRILILGAGFLQSFVIKRARQLGYYVIAIDKNQTSPGFKEANESAVIDIIDQEACLSFAKKKQIDGVITAATDYGVLSTAYIAKEMHLPGLDYEVAKNIKNKYLIHKQLSNEMEPSMTQYYEVDSLECLEGLRERLHYPVMVKPCDGSGSRAIRKVENFEEMVRACKEAMECSIQKKALVEEFIEGREYGADIFVYQGEIYMIGVLKKKMTNPPIYAELGHSFPSGLEDLEETVVTIKKAIKVLGINFGAVNIDFIVTERGEVCIIDMGARLGGNLISSHILPLGTGQDYVGMAIKSAVGDPVEIMEGRAERAVATRILALTPGRIVKIPDIASMEQQFGVTILHTMKVGDSIRQYHTNLDGCGYVLAVAGNVREARRNATMAKQYLDAHLIRE